MILRQPKLNNEMAYEKNVSLHAAPSFFVISKPTYYKKEGYKMVASCSWRKKTYQGFAKNS